MTQYQPGDLVLLAFPYGGSARAKNRPALVTLDTGDADAVVARITTRIYETPHDVSITEWQPAGLLAPSVVRLHKIATIEKVLMQRQLGTLQPTDWRRIRAVMRQTYGRW